MSLTAVPNTATAEDEKLQMLRINIRHWRKDKGLPFRYMPVQYWDQAIVLARLLSARRVACVLGLNLEELKRRIEGRHSPGAHTTVQAQAPADVDTPAVITPRICDLPDIALRRPVAADAVALTPCASVAEGGKVPTECQSLTSPPPEPPVRPVAEPRAVSVAEDAVLELTAPDGTKLTVRMPVGSFNVSSVIHDFRSRA